MSNGQDISLQGAYRQDQDAKLEVKPTDFDATEMLIYVWYASILIGGMRFG